MVMSSLGSDRPKVVKPVLNGRLKVYKTKVLMEKCSLMKVERPASILLTGIKR